MTSRQSDNSPRKTRPRNFLARREQWRLFMLVGSLMLVIILMSEARKPKNWVWLTRLKTDELTEGEMGGGEIDTRITPSGTNIENPELLPGMLVEPSFRFERKADLDDRDRAFERVEKDFWKQQLKLLDSADRRRIPLALKAVRDQQPLSEDDAQAWSETLEILNERWKEYTEDAISSVTLDTQLTDQDRGTWLSILEELQTKWNEQLRPAFEAAADPASLTSEQSKQIREFQQLFDQLSLEGIVDGTPIPWPNETNAWFRLVEYLNKADQEKLAEADLPYVGFRQLYQQPDQYRGEMIRIRGSAHRAYHLSAPTNIAGIDGYYKFIISLAGHSDDPVLVYALELPEGFPEVKDLNVDKEVTDLVDVDVEFTGYFFKNAAYQAGDGIRVAPLVLAKEPTWTPRVARGEPEPPNWYLFAAAAFGTAVLGTAIAAFVMKRHGATPSQHYAPTAQVQPSQFAALADEDVKVPSERLGEMSAANTRQAHGSNDSSS